MPPERYEPDDPRAWLRHASSDLALARADVPGVGMEAFCFHAQQAAEKAIKAVLLKERVPFPYVHDLGRLLHLAADKGIAVPEEVRAANRLSDYAVFLRYPFAGTPVGAAQRREAVEIAETVLRWAEDIVDHSTGM